MSYQSRSRLIAEADLSSAASGRPQIGPHQVGSRRTIVQRALFTLSLWRQRVATRRHLAQLDAGTLRDVGISPAAAAFESGKPFWREMGSLR